ncbi:VC0807 family protein [Alicyclobacillus fodiniaquatilis]|uniref:VC0807 family protein n=1 Tax=Alicyclobacillus fodiniaquatilis TaxID=1661150 RepID=A0ABW4JG25_9BACL
MINRSKSHAGRAVNMLFTQIVLDVVIPYAIYKLASSHGWSPVHALTLGGVWSLCMVIKNFIRSRRINGMALFMLIAITLGIGLALISNDPRYVVAKDSIFTGGLGIVFLVSTAFRRSVMFNACQAFVTKGDKQGVKRWDDLWSQSQSFKRAILRMDYVWGVALLLEAMTRVILVYTLPIHDSISASPILAIGTLVLLMMWTGDQGKKIRLIEQTEMSTGIHGE